MRDDLQSVLQHIKALYPSFNPDDFKTTYTATREVQNYMNLEKRYPLISVLLTVPILNNIAFSPLS